MTMALYPCYCNDAVCQHRQYCVYSTRTCLWSPPDGPGKERCIGTSTCKQGHYCKSNFCERHVAAESLSFTYSGTPVHFLEFHTRPGDCTGVTGSDPVEGTDRYQVYVDIEFYSGLNLRNAKISDFKRYFKEFKTIVPDPYDTPLAGGSLPFLKNGFPHTSFDGFITLHSYDNYRLTGRLIDPSFVQGRRNLNMNACQITVDFDLDLQFLVNRQIITNSGGDVREEEEEAEMEQSETTHHFWEPGSWGEVLQQRSLSRRYIYLHDWRLKVGFMSFFAFTIFTIIGVFYYCKSTRRRVELLRADVYHLNLYENVS